MISFHKYCFAYSQSDPDVLSEIDLHIKAGEFVLLAGASGSGKSTLLKAISGIIPHYTKGFMKGYNHTSGKQVAETSFSSITEKAGVVFQNPETQFFNLSVEDEICFGMYNRGWEESIIKSRLDEMLQLFSLRQVAKLPPHALSEGQKQKTILASVMATQPDILLLDEPLAHLDNNNATILISQLRLLNQKGITIVIAEHRFNKLIECATRVIVMDNGRIAEDNTPVILLDNAIREKYGLRDIQEYYISNPEKNENATPLAIGLNDALLGYKSGFTFHIPSLKIKQQSVLGIMGSNGCGKTTILKVLAGLSKLKGGKTMPEKIIPGKHSTLVFQQSDTQLFMETVEEEIYGNSNDKLLIKKLIAYFGLESVLTKNPHCLSEGQKQRVVLAAAIARQTPVIMLDEPTTGMDGFYFNQFVQFIKSDFMKNKTIIIASHDNELICKTTDSLFNIN